MRHAILCVGMLLALLSGCAPGSEKPAKGAAANQATTPASTTQTASSAAAKQGTEPAGEVAPAGANQAAGTLQSPAKAGESQAGPAAGALPIPALGYNAREGQAVYRHYCSTCHGDEGHGDGFNAYNLDPKPRDLADPAFQAKRSDEDLVAVIRSGGGAAGLSTGMPPWGCTLSERKVRNVVDFLRTLPQKSQ